MNTDTDIYIVTEFGCDSGYNDMYTPRNSVFKNREDAYKYYTDIKDTIIKDKLEYGIDFYIDHSVKNNGECIIQKGIDSGGAKRPIGVLIKQYLMNH